jgi:serine/threonine protein phosphatase PrpC
MNRSLCRHPDGAVSDMQWRVAGASVRGSRHEKSGEPCQDAHNWAVLPGGVLIAAVADGAGSAPFAEVGSQRAAQTAIESLSAALALRLEEEESSTLSDATWQALLVAALSRAQEAIDAEALARSVTARDLATTLILLAATPGSIAAIQVGDGAAVVCDGEQRIAAITCPQSGEYINETSFLIAPEVLEQAQFTVWRGTVARLAVFSDGLQHLALKMPEGTPHAPFFAPLFRFADQPLPQLEAQEQLTAFLSSPRILERADDDLTLLLASLK